MTAPTGGRLALALLPALLALPLVTAAHHARPAPFGDRLRTYRTAPGPLVGPEPVPRAAAARVEARDPRTGALRWTHGRDGKRPVALAAVPGHVFALWSDGLVTDTERAAGASVRWHRAVPDLTTPGALLPLGAGDRMLAVVTPRRIAAYRTADGDLRWVLPAAEGCAFAPGRQARTRGVLLVAQPCRAGGPWTTAVIAVDALGRITPGRTPLANEPRPDKAVAAPR
ncbi:PQQ-binding-like beta-propeller repeat protein [Streptomyces liangshanensis]|uniref:hypothetical protein n=1 Tax=Streptomyces liangshanensis TaxID=2717324 RepID=UPI0036D95AA7